MVKTKMFSMCPPIRSMATTKYAIHLTSPDIFRYKMLEFLSSSSLEWLMKTEKVQIYPWLVISANSIKVFLTQFIALRLAPKHHVD